jgi:hypothetical protein
MHSLRLPRGHPAAKPIGYAFRKSAGCQLAARYGTAGAR